MTRLCDSRKDMQDVGKVMLIVFFVECAREIVFWGNVSRF